MLKGVKKPCQKQDLGNPAHKLHKKILTKAFACKVLHNF